MKTKFLATLAVLIFAVCAFGQTSLTSTTLAAAVAASDTEVTLASVTGVAAPTPPAAVGSILVVGSEAMRVNAVNTTTKIVQVSRGYNSRVYAHASGATVYEGTLAEFASNEPVAGNVCTAGTSWAYTPLIVLGTGRTWTCTNSAWLNTTAVAFGGDVSISGALTVTGDIDSSANQGTAGTSVTATESGDSFNHVTKLVFSAVAGPDPGSAVDLAAGYLLYTFPAGIINITGLDWSVSGDGDTTCDGDTPDVGLGTTAGTGAVATLDGTPAFENVLTGQTFSGTMDGTADTTSVTVAPAMILAAADHTLYLNAADGWAGDCTTTFSGTIYIVWNLIE